jgi:hypothetical protein
MRIATFVAWIAFAATSLAQEAPARMTQERLHAIISEAAQEVRVQGNVIAFRLGEIQLFGVSDATADRMRIFAPVKPLDEATSEELLAALHANFHTVLDARYAISNGVIFAVYLHPLSPLTREQILSAMRQVAAARASFGGSYSSGGPAFGGVR